MNAREALARLRQLDVPVVSTADAAAVFRQSTSAASMTLARLADSGLVTPVRHGLYWIDGTLAPYRLAEYLSAPFGSYVSLQSALHVHGLIEQVPAIVYAVSLGRTRRVVTSAGSFSFHHVAPEVFGGFIETAADGKMATAEKAIFDVAYLASGRSRLFASIPEIELPRGFDRRACDAWVRRVPSARSRTLTERRLDSMLAGAHRE